MIKVLGHAGLHRRVAINVGAGFVPGTNVVVMGAAIAGGKLGWEMIGIRDGFEGLLHPERYPGGGRLTSVRSLSRILIPPPEVSWARRPGLIRFIPLCRCRRG